jgi:hypothetical protein
MTPADHQQEVKKCKNKLREILDDYALTLAWLEFYLAREPSKVQPLIEQKICDVHEEFIKLDGTAEHFFEKAERLQLENDLLRQAVKTACEGLRCAMDKFGQVETYVEPGGFETCVRATMDLQVACSRLEANFPTAAPAAPS